MSSGRISTHPEGPVDCARRSGCHGAAARSVATMSIRSAAHAPAPRRQRPAAPVAVADRAGTVAATSRDPAGQLIEQTRRQGGARRLQQHVRELVRRRRPLLARIRGRLGLRLRRLVRLLRHQLRPRSEHQRRGHGQVGILDRVPAGQRRGGPRGAQRQPGRPQAGYPELRRQHGQARQRVAARRHRRQDRARRLDPRDVGTRAVAPAERQPLERQVRRQPVGQPRRQRLVRLGALVERHDAVPGLDQERQPPGKPRPGPLGHRHDEHRRRLADQAAGRDRRPRGQRRGEVEPAEEHARPVPPARACGWSAVPSPPAAAR